MCCCLFGCVFYEYCCDWDGFCVVCFECDVFVVVGDVCWWSWIWF